jgi:hypothetical protein
MINFLIEIVPTDGTKAANQKNKRNFSTSPFLGQLSGKQSASLDGP